MACLKFSFSTRYGLPRDPGCAELLQSERIGWTSIYAAAYRHEGRTEEFETVRTPRQKLLVVTSGTGEFEVWLKGKWRKVVRPAGWTSLLPPERYRRLRWRSITPTYETAQIYLPQSFFLAAADEYRRSGWPHPQEPLDSTELSDPVVTQVAAAIVAAVRSGAPDLYAQTAAEFLALHLLRVENRWPSAKEDLRRTGRVSDRRLGTVIEYMRANYMEQLSLEQLAREAGVSRHHFAHLFKMQMGTSPHQYLSETRLQAAALMLVNTDKTVLEVALACGYYGTAHLSSAFRRRFGQTPTGYRAADVSRGSEPANVVGEDHSSKSGML